MIELRSIRKQDVGLQKPAAATGSSEMPGGISRMSDLINERHGGLLNLSHNVAANLKLGERKLML